MKTTLKDVAQFADVSTATVSRVLNQSPVVSQDVRERVMEAVQALNYSPNAVARSLRVMRTQTIGVLVPDISNPYFMNLVRAVEEEIESANYNILLASSDERKEKEESLLNVLLEKRVDGIILAPSENLPNQSLNEVLRRRVHLSIIDRIVEGLSADTVAEENQQSVHQLIRHLISLGHTKIGVIHSGHDISTAVQRRQGLNRALEDAHITVPEKWMGLGDYDQDTGYTMAMKIFAQNWDEIPTALFCGNNVITIGAMTALEELNLRVPNDVSIVSFGELPFPRFVHPRVTAVRQNPRQVGHMAAVHLLERLNGYAGVARRTILPTEISFGESVLDLRKL